MIRISTFTEAGGHPDNEDAFLVEPHPLAPDSWLCFLADGVGGRRGGARAAQLACRAGLDAAKQRRPNDLLLPSAWVDLLSEVDDLVHRDPEAGFATIIGFTLGGNWLAGASCGDSAVLVRAGDGACSEPTAGQNKNPPFGSSVAHPARFGCALQGEWSVMAVTDGGWKYAGWHRIVPWMEVVRGEDLLAKIQTAARLPGSGRFPDDFTAVLFENDLTS
jgi:hypothetical protein